MPTAAFAQSTGSVDFEKEVIVVTGTRTQDVGGVQTPDAPKAKAVVTQEMISRSGPGQTVLDTINIVPGVSFQNNDAYGNAGGTLTIRGFDSTRISYTLDGIQLNDSGNYNIYSNFSIDPELIEQVNVNLGSTDVDSPTASAVGGTINQRTRNPGKELGGRFSASLGQYDYRRFFGMIDTGELTSVGTRAFIAGSTSKYDNPFNNYGKMDRTQLNAKVYQPIGANGDFVSVAGRYNRDRNNFFGSVPLRLDREPNQGFPTSRDEREYDINYPCTVDAPQAGAADAANSCGTEFDRRYNPSNSWNFRGNSRFTLAEGLTLTVDPSFQYTKANGGGTDTAREYGYDLNPTGGRSNCSTTPESATVQCEYGYFGGDPYVGIDLNGDGDLLDTVTVLTPSQTRTRRYTVISGLRYEINDDHTVRATFTRDHANHRQTGQIGYVRDNGEPVDVFPVDDPILTADGAVVQKRDRQSYAILNQIAAEYRGEFLDNRLTLNVGARLPFFKRDLENFCATSSASGFVECSGQVASIDEDAVDLNSSWSPPQRRVFKYSKFLPNVGVVYDFTPQISGFVSYAKGLSVPSTDNLYNSFYFDRDEAAAKPKPETTDTIDGGVRYRSSKIQAQLSAWHTSFKNRIAEAYDAELDQRIFRNLGSVEKYGIDGSIAYQPIPQLTAYVFGSWNKSKIKNNLIVGEFGGITDCDNIPGTATDLDIARSCAFTKGNREAGSPKYTYGTSFSVEPVQGFSFGLTAKRTGPRYVYDNNQPVFFGDTTSPSVGNEVREIFPAKVPAYWLVNMDARLNMGAFAADLDKTYIQLNVYNLFDKLYAGGFGGFSNQPVSSSGFYSESSSSGIPFVQMGAPRTVSVTFNVGF
ncbi:TonB-dependent receptor [Sphingomonas edaphi]|uniref:TonB-dependent receptor n=2 Tax=Sphingomonas edaphi TaxID=2315689 RepID=A0A418PZJ1_9SPHN|nr:TonB-dependent receptor [Sphingomonas edaphi]